MHACCAEMEMCRTLQGLHQVASRSMRDRVPESPTSSCVPTATEYGTATPTARLVCITYDVGHKESVAHKSRNILFERVAATASPCFRRYPAHYSVALMLLIQRAWSIAAHGRDAPQEWWRHLDHARPSLSYKDEVVVLEPRKIARLQVRRHQMRCVPIRILCVRTKVYDCSARACE